jgi:hypothetical protein
VPCSDDLAFVKAVAGLERDDNERLAREHADHVAGSGVGVGEAADVGERRLVRFGRIASALAPPVAGPGMASRAVAFFRLTRRIFR